MTYQFYAVRIFVTNWEPALAFYRDTVGFAMAFESAELGWAEFDLGGARIAIERCDPADPETKDLVGRFVGVSLNVEDIHAVYADLTTKGVMFTSPPEIMPWGGVLAHFKDLEGNVLTLLGRVPQVGATNNHE